MKRILTTSIIAAAFIIGCGENSSVTDAKINYNPENIFAGRSVKVNYEDYKVKVIDDEILHANVSASECNSSEELGSGEYLLKNCVTKPSYISVENGVIGDTNVTQTFPLILNVSQTNLDDNFVVTPLTTLLADANSTEVETILNKFGIDEKEAFENPKKMKLLQKLNAIYLKAESDGVVSKKVKFIQTLRDVIKNTAITGSDFNVTDIAKKVEQKSQQNPALFGLVFIGDLSNSDNILEEIKKVQNPTKITFLGLVFDAKIADANITIYRGDNNQTLANIQADSNGKWNWEINDTIADMIKNEDFIVILKARARNNVQLVSSISSIRLREMLNMYKKITPNKAPDLVISNVTTAENAILDKRNALRGDSKSYENNRTDLKTYYSDKILTAAAVIKDVVDNNNSDLVKDYNNTYSFVKANIKDDKNVDFTDSVTEANTTKPLDELKKNVSDDAILSVQIYYTPKVTTDGFEEAAKQANNTFYRILAYYNNNEFVREYQRIETFPGEYRVKTCYLYGDSTSDWQCDIPVVISNANFSNGSYVAVTKENRIKYLLDKKDTLFVPELCKNYNIYEVNVKNLKGVDLLSATSEILVDSFDVVDMFRRMPTLDSNSFNKLKNLVSGKNREEVNIELNRFVREQLENVENYFSDSDTNTQCQ